MPQWTRLATALGFIVAALSAAGCQPACQQLCVENARYVDACLEHWEALWPDLGHVDANTYIATCQARVTTTLRLQPIETQRASRLRCADDLSLLTTSIGCNDYQPNDVDLDPNGEENNGVIPRPQGGN